MRLKKTQAVYDPACGSAKLLIDIRHLLESPNFDPHAITLAVGAGKTNYYTPPAVIKLINSLILEEGLKPVFRERGIRDHS